MIFLLSSIVISFLLFFISFKTKEKWMTDEKMLPLQWKKLNIISLVVALISNIGIFFMIPDHVDGSASMSVLLASVTSSLIYTSIQTVTDFKVRRAYRWTLILGYLSVIASATWDYLSHDMTSTFMFYLLVLVISSFGMFFKGIGASDARAMILICASLVPIAGVQGLTQYLYLFILFLLVYVIIAKIKNRDIKILSTKLSFPMVPIFIWPALIIILKTVLL